MPYEVACYSQAVHARTCCAVMRCATHLYLYQQYFTKYHNRGKKIHRDNIKLDTLTLTIFFFLMGDT